jgi:oxygen-dependent protoporphyrinogen oxidase
MGVNTVVIVGSGGAGLAAARELTAAGRDVVVLEKGERIGGRAATVNWHGFDLEIGASVLTSQDKPVLDYVEKFGLELVPAPGGLNITVPRDGKLYTANFLNPFSLLTWGGVSLSARLSILKLLPPVIGRMLSLGGDTYHLERGGSEGDDVSFSEAFSEQISPELLEQCFLAMMETMMGYDEDDLSWKAFLSLMSVYMGGKSMAIKGGMSALTQRLAEGLDVRLGAAVKKIELTDTNSATLTYEQGGKAHKLAVEKVILAVEGDKITGLIPESHMRPAWKKMFSQIKYSSGAMQYLLLKTTYKPNVPMVYLPVSTGHPINQISFEAQDETHLLAMTDPRVDSDWQSKSSAELAKISMEVIAKYFPELEGTLEDEIIFRWPSLVPTLGPGYLTALAEFKQDPQEGPLYFCGDWHNSPNFAGAMTSGIEAAKRLLDDTYEGASGTVATQ